MHQELEDSLDVQLPAELIMNIASHLARSAPNDVASSLKLVRKDFALSLRGSQHDVLHLSQPVHPDTFAQRWALGPLATRPLTLEQRKQLVRLTAASGVVANLEVAVRAASVAFEDDEHLWQEAVEVAARAGQLAACDWLQQQRRKYDRWVVLQRTLSAAARGGHLEVCKTLKQRGAELGYSAFTAAAASGSTQLVEWLLAEGCPQSRDAAGEAARYGQVGTMDMLLQANQTAPADVVAGVCEELIQGAAWGCNLADFQRVHAWCVGRRRGRRRRAVPESRTAAAGGPLGAKQQAAAVLRAALGPTPDWAAKAGWLLDEKGYVAVDVPCGALAFGERSMALCQPSIGQRLAWLRGRGCLGASVFRTLLLHWAVWEGSTAAVSELLDSGAALAADDGCTAAARGHLAVLQLLHARGNKLDVSGGKDDLFRAAAEGGHVAVLDWLAATLFPDGLPPPGTHPLTPATFAAAASSYSVPALTWLAARGCPCDEACWKAVGGASVEVVEWLAEHGCPFEADGAAYVRAGRCGNLSAVVALRRLGCPWSAATFTEAVRQRVPLHMLRWMMQEGWLLDLEEAMAAAQANYERVADNYESGVCKRMTAQLEASEEVVELFREARVRERRRREAAA